MELGELVTNKEKLFEIRTAYSEGAAAARSGEPLSAVPTYRETDCRQAWLNGWYDTTVNLGLAALVSPLVGSEATAR